MTPMTRSNAMAKISAIRSGSDEMQTMLGIFDEMLFHDCHRGDYNKLMISVHKSLALMFDGLRSQFYQLHELARGNGEALSEALRLCEDRVYEGECAVEAMGALVRRPLDQDGRYQRFMEASRLGILNATTNFQRQIARVRSLVRQIRPEAIPPEFDAPSPALRASTKQRSTAAAKPDKVSSLPQQVAHA
jgi:hypothetical protein